jgi:hypothetical protein
MRHGEEAEGRKGSHARRRFKATHVDRAFALYRRYGMFVVAVPALLPPPAPFKIRGALLPLQQVSSPVRRHVSAAMSGVILPELLGLASGCRRRAPSVRVNHGTRSTH